MERHRGLGASRYEGVQVIAKSGREASSKSIKFLAATQGYPETAEGVLVHVMGARQVESWWGL